MDRARDRKSATIDRGVCQIDVVAVAVDLDQRRCGDLVVEHVNAVDQEMLVQAMHLGFRIKEVPVPTRYFAEASSASFSASVTYGLSILWLLARYLLHRSSWINQRQFECFPARYRRAE